MIRDKRFYKSFAGLTASIALQNLLTYSVNLADNIAVYHGFGGHNGRHMLSDGN